MREQKVKHFFEQTDHYLAYNYNLRIRTETVGYFLQNRHFHNVLDMPCGTGDISVPFLNQFGHLTLMDFSANMIALAKKRVPDSQHQKVTFLNTDFYKHDFGEETFDLVICLGILAHINDPWVFLQKIADRIRPGGYLILQNTNSNHWFARLIGFYLWMRRLVGLDKYKLNKINEQQLLQNLRKLNFQKQEVFCYNQSFLGLSRIFNNDLKYRLTRNYFGFAGKNKNARSGSDCTYLFQKEN